MSEKPTEAPEHQRPIVVMEVSDQMETALQYESSIAVERKKTHVFSEEAQQTQKSQLSFWHYLREVLSAALALGIVVVIGLFSPSIWLQSHLIFCAFFLVVFIVAVRSHAVATYSVGFLVAGCYSWLLWQQFQANPSFDMLQVFIEPFLLFVSSIVINEMLRKQKLQNIVNEKQYGEKEAFLQEIKQRYQTTQRLNAELEQQLIRQAFSVSTVNEKMAYLWGLQGQEQYDAILDIVMYAIDAKFCGLYLLCNGRMSLCASQREEISQYSTTVSLSLDVKDALISRTIQSRQVCTIRDTLTDSRATQRVVAMMAGPLVDDHNQVVGVVIVDDIPLLKFLPATVRLFGSLLRMISMAMPTVRPIADVRLGFSLPFVPDTEGEAVQTAIPDRDAIEDDHFTQARTVHVLPVVRP
jgi:hypothetical protein